MSLASFDGGFFKGVNDETNFTNEYTYYVFSQWTAAVNQWKIFSNSKCKKTHFYIGTYYLNFDLGRFGRKTILIVEMLRTLASLFNEIFVSALFYTCTTYMEGELFSIKKHQIGSFVKCTTFFQQENVLNFAKTSINGKVRKNLEWFS